MSTLHEKIKEFLQDKNSDQLMSEGDIDADGANSLVNEQTESDTVEDKKEEIVEKVDMSEHLTALSEGEELSEEFKKKAATIMEAAVAAGVAKEMASINEKYEASLIEAVDKIRNELAESIDEMLSELIEEWVNENRIALQAGAKNEVVESFIDGLKTLFTEHYIEIPEEKVDILDEQAQVIEDLATKLEEQSKEIAELSDIAEGLARLNIIESVGRSLTMTEYEKFKSYCEGVSFETPDQYEDKVKVIKEQYFPVTKGDSPVGDETPVLVGNETANTVVNAYVNALKNPLKF